MVERTFLGKPLRDISLECNVETLSLDEFIEEVKEGLDGYQGNMKGNGSQDPAYFSNTSHHMEVWIESFLAWFEVEQDLDK